MIAKHNNLKKHKGILFIGNLKKLSKTLINLIFCASCVSCTTLGPDYKKPTSNWLKSWQPSLYGTLDTSASSNIELSFWWFAFNDKHLNQLIKLALSNNIDLQKAGLRVLQAQAQLGIAQSSLYPQLNQASGSFAGAKTRRRGGVLANSDDSIFSYQSSYNLGWEIDFWGKFERSVESADAGFFSSIANQQNMQVLISAQVAQLYFTFKTTQQRIAIANKNALIQKRSYEITQQLFTQGQQSELDLQQAKAQYLATKATIPSLEIVLTKTRNALAQLLSKPPSDIEQLQSSPGQLPVFDTIVLDEIPSNIILRRPDVRTAAWLVAMQSAQIGIAQADYYPSISLFGTLSWNGNSNGNTPDNGLLSSGVGFNWSVFDFGRIENNILLQNIKLQEQIENYQSSLLNAAREIDDSAITVVKTREQMNILKQSVLATERSLVLANSRYKEGYSGFQRVLDAQRALFNQTNQQLINRGEHITAVINLYKSLGGGWSHMPANSMISQKNIKQIKIRNDNSIPLMPTLHKNTPLKKTLNTKTEDFINE